MLNFSRGATRSVHELGVPGAASPRHNTSEHRAASSDHSERCPECSD